MKVISIIDSSDLYGKERANFNVDHLLKSKGYEVVVLINAIANERVRREACAFRYINVTFPRNIVGSLRLYQYVRAFFLTIKQVRNILLKEKPDFILVPTEIALSYLYFAIINSNATVVFRCGDSPLLYRKKGIVRNVYSFFWKRWISKRIDILACNAHYLQQQMIESGYKLKEHDSIIYNYPPKRILKSDYAEYAESNGIIRIGFIGRIVPDKGVLEMCQAAIKAEKKGHPIYLYIAGDPKFDNNYFDTIRFFIESHKDMQSQIFFLGNVNDIEKFYNHIDVVCIPSIYEEPMANVVTEAKLYQHPCIIFNQGGMPEIVEHKKTGYICDHVSVDKLADSFIYYDTYRDEIRKQGLAAFESIESLGLNYSNFEKKWLNVFNYKG